MRMRSFISSWDLPYMVRPVGVMSYFFSVFLIWAMSSPGLTWWASGGADVHRLICVKPISASSRNESSRLKS